MNGRGNFGVMRPVDNPYSSMGGWDRSPALDLSKYFQGQQQQQPDAMGQAAGGALSGIAGSAIGAFLRKRKLEKLAEDDTPITHDRSDLETLHRQQARPQMDYRYGIDDVDASGKPRIPSVLRLPSFARGGKLKRGLNIVGENGPEIAIKDGDETKIVPLTTDASVTSNVTNRPMQPIPQPEQAPDMSQIVGAPAPDATPYAPAGEAATQAMAGQPQPNIADNTWAEIQRREGKQFDATPVLDAQGQPVIGPDGKPMMRPGKDNAKTHNWKDVLKSIGLGLLKGGQMVGPNDNIASMLGKLVGGAGSGGVATALDRNADEKLGNDMALQKLYGDYQRQYGTQQQRQADAQKQRLNEANIAVAEGRPDLAKAEQARKARLADIADFKAVNDAEYKRNVIALGATKADEIRRNNEKLYELKSRGLDQNDVRIKILQDRNEEIARSNRAKEDILKQRVATAGERLNWDKAKLDRVQAFQMQLQKDRQQYGEQAAQERARQALKRAGFPDSEIEQWMNPTQFVNPDGYNLNPDGFLLESNP